MGIGLAVTISNMEHNDNQTQTYCNNNKHGHDDNKTSLSRYYTKDYNQAYCNNIKHGTD